MASSSRLGRRCLWRDMAVTSPFLHTVRGTVHTPPDLCLSNAWLTDASHSGEVPAAAPRLSLSLSTGGWCLALLLVGIVGLTILPRALGGGHPSSPLCPLCPVLCDDVMGPSDAVLDGARRVRATFCGQRRPTVVAVRCDAEAHQRSSAWRTSCHRMELASARVPSGVTLSHN